MPFKKKLNDDFFIKDNRIHLSKEFFKSNKTKKITGSRLATVLGLDSFSSPVKAWAIMNNIYFETMDSIYSDTGNVVEPKINKYVSDLLDTKFKVYNPFEIKWDAFPENKIFGGIPDGEPIDENNKFLYPEKRMLEIKTTSIDSFLFKKVGNSFVLQKDQTGLPIVKTKAGNLKKWFDENNQIIISKQYLMQLGLYCYLRNITKGFFAVAFLNVEDYLNPQKVNINERRVELADFDLNLEDFKTKYIDTATKWYEDYILTGISPEFSEADLKWFYSELKNE